jgi:hypothetical protein
MKQFAIGRTYSTRSICDHNTIFAFRILGRTEKTISTKINGRVVRRRLQVRDGVEHFKPYGTYSMCAIISAD